MKKQYQFIYHVIPWVFLYSLPFIFNKLNLENFDLDFYITWTLKVAYYILVFYTFFLKINPRYLKSNMVLKYAGIAAGTLLGLALVKLFVTMLFIFIFNIDLADYPQRYLEGLISGGFFILISVFVNFTQNWFRIQKIRTELEKQQLQSELNMLKYQINPHFLFNTLNNIYSLVRKKSDKAEDAVLKLSGLMRYMIYDTKEQRVPLKKEIEYVTNFIDLQKMRLKHSENIIYSFEGRVKDQMIAPMILIPFIENAFKHSPQKEENKICISIKIDENRLGFKVHNKILSAREREEYSGIGLKNVKKRLDLDYPGKHNLCVYNQNGRFYVDLIIDLSS